MILAKQKDCPVDRNAILSENTFKIKASAKAFKILSAGIYSDPISAPIRELSANAWDAHVEVGNKEPFIVHLPNSLEPHFAVRDFGPGMSESKILTLYVTYFDSDKTGTNDLIGGLGLGSKSPFCYTDSFTVTSYQKGKKLIFTAFLENGIPSIAKLGEESTNEKDGLEVCFSVQPKDMFTFADRARQIFNLFKNRPTIKGVPGFVLETPEYTLHGKGWRIRKSSLKNSLVIMGNIGYRIDTRSLYSKLNAGESALLNCCVEIDFNIGDLEITASREDLQYDEKTIDLLKKRLSEIIIEMEKVVQEKFKVCTTLWDARCLHYQLFGYNNSGENTYYIRSVLQSSKFLWNGQEISSHQIPIIEDQNVYHYTSTATTQAPDPALAVWKVYWGHAKRRGSEKKTRKSNERYLSCVSDIVFFKKDLDKSFSRVANYIQNNQSKVVYLIECENKTDYKKFLDRLGYPESKVNLVSSLPKAPPSPRASYARLGTKKKRAFEFIATKADQWYERAQWDKVELELDGTDYFYVEIKRFSILNPIQLINTNNYYTSNVSPATFVSLIGLVKQCGINVDKVYGIQSHAMTKIKQRKQWKNFIEFSAKIVTDHIENNKQKIYDSYWFNSYRQNDKIGSSRLMDGYHSYTDKITASTEFSDFYKKYSFMLTNKDNIGTINDEIFRILGINKSDIYNNSKMRPTYDLDPLAKKIFSKYPLLCYISSRDIYGSCGSYMKDIVSYIKLIEGIR